MMDYLNFFPSSAPNVIRHSGLKVIVFNNVGDLICLLSWTLAQQFSPLGVVDPKRSSIKSHDTTFFIHVFHSCNIQLNTPSTRISLQLRLTSSA